VRKCETESVGERPTEGVYSPDGLPSIDDRFAVTGPVCLYRQLIEGASLRWQGVVARLLAGWAACGVVGILGYSSASTTSRLAPR